MKKFVLNLCALLIFVSCEEAQQFELLKASTSHGGIYINDVIKPKHVIVSSSSSGVLVSLMASGNIRYFVLEGGNYKPIEEVDESLALDAREFLGNEILNATNVVDIFSNGKSIIYLKRDNSIVAGGDPEGGAKLPLSHSFQQRIVTIEVVGVNYKILFQDGNHFSWGEDYLPDSSEQSFRTMVGRSFSNNMAHSILGFMNQDMGFGLIDLRNTFLELLPSGELKIRKWELDELYYYDIEEEYTPVHLLQKNIKNIQFNQGALVSTHFDGSIIAIGTPEFGADISPSLSTRGNQVYEIYASSSSFAFLFNNGDFEIVGNTCYGGGKSSFDYYGLKVVSISESPEGFVLIFNNGLVESLRCIST